VVAACREVACVRASVPMCPCQRKRFYFHLRTCVCSLQALSKDELIALDRLVGHGMYEHTNMCVCVCVCVCVCIIICICKHIYVRIYVETCVCIYTIHTQTHTHTQAHTRINYLHTQYTHTHTHTQNTQNTHTPELGAKADPTKFKRIFTGRNFQKSHRH
jgi:hypothetical protein